jgi:cellular nucleic acid-binding protein
MVFIYTLKLQEGKYYIGKTNNPHFSLDTSFNSNIAWTKIYKPIKVIEFIPDKDISELDKYTIQYMDKYGIDNVRGGTFISTELDAATIERLKRRNRGSNFTCFLC